jgi:hypothetical protein
MASIAEVAKQAVAARAAGNASVTLGTGASAQQFNLAKGGYCARFVRQCCEVALGIKPGTWDFAAPDALGMEAKLKAAGKLVPTADRKPGDVVAINNGSWKYGHIGLVVNKTTIAENTSSGTRGDPRAPGTKLTHWADIADRVTGVYRVQTSTVPPEPTGVPTAPKSVILQDLNTGRKIGEITQEAAARLVAGVLTVAPNGDHRADQGKLYLAKRS